MIEVKNVGKSYDGNPVLERLNVTVKEGEFVTLVGASGCGKSTFLKMLLGTESPTSGELLLDGKPIASEPGPDRGIVFQQYSVFPHMTVLENVMAAVGFAQRGLTGYLFGSKRKQARLDAEAILKEVGLGHALKKYPHELSGGMKQRLAIAQALLGKPRILLLDEASVGLDQASRRALNQHVRALCDEQQLTVIWTTHLLDEILPSDPVVMLNRGRVVAQGQADALSNGTTQESLSDAFERLSRASEEPAL